MRAICLAVLFLLICSTSSWTAEKRQKEIPINVSIIRLIGSPEKYDGKRVTLRGFLKIEFEGDALYLHREDYERALLANSIALPLSNDQIRAFKKYDRRYVTVEGVFSRCDETRFVCNYSGFLKVIAIDFWPARPEVEQRESGR